MNDTEIFNLVKEQAKIFNLENTIDLTVTLVETFPKDIGSAPPMIKILYLARKAYLAGFGVALIEHGNCKKQKCKEAQHGKEIRQ